MTRNKIFDRPLSRFFWPGHEVLDHIGEDVRCGSKAFPLTAPIYVCLTRESESTAAGRHRIYEYLSESDGIVRSTPQDRALDLL